jgi:hypothetical protein
MERCFKGQSCKKLKVERCDSITVLNVPCLANSHLSPIFFMGTAYAEKQTSTSTSTASKPFFAPANIIQRQQDKTESVNYLSMINLDEANKSNIANMNQFSNERYLLSLFLNVPFYVTTSRPASNEAEDITPLTLAIAAWQYDYINDTTGKFKKTKGPVTAVNGKYKDSLGALIENGFDPKGKSQDWKTIDQNDAKAVLEAEKQYKEAVKENPSEETTRQAIVDLATSQAGTVVAVNRGDNSKIGWERIARFYEVAEEEDLKVTDPFHRARNAKGVPTDVPEETDLTKSKLAGIKAANKFANDKTGDWSWCGIFTVWAIRSITGKGSWNEGPQGFGERRSDLRNAKKGDIINIKASSNPNNHHFILAQDIPSTATDSYVIYAVEGNIDLQGIKATHRWKLSDVAGYYKTV